jgi:solute carrier family 25 aspartate/glutamate transporter 12/13
LFAKYKSKVIFINNVASTFFQVKINLIAAAQASGGSQTISYPYFVAFISLLSNIELIKKIYLNATNGSRTTEVTKGR